MALLDLGAMEVEMTRLSEVSTEGAAEFAGSSLWSKIKTKAMSPQEAVEAVAEREQLMDETLESGRDAFEIDTDGNVKGYKGGQEFNVAEKEELVKRAQRQKDIGDKATEYFRLKYNEPNFELDTFKPFEENFKGETEQAKINRKVLEKHIEELKTKLKGKSHTQLEREAERTMDTKKRSYLNYAAGFAAVLLTGVASYLILQSMADNDSGCYKLEKGKKKLLDCQAHESTLKPACSCSSLDKLRPKCLASSNDITACTDGTLYFYVKKTAWQELGEITNGIKNAVETGAGDLQQIVEIFIKYWWIILILVPVGIALINLTAKRG